ncbi:MULTISPECIES: hypothetical protein [unclassified Rhodococcus (in: high G+C Gram-positive bacteria)]|uniref:hypothetical protein n=1 Tax=unclassified Rhodococcus (in: high G+C Gram-positive bacteria) TaxID=192944 RepID=UPI00158262BB|nr:hypothetical protein [Rhodococcus sp. W8901]QKT09460.1 hypothetical protein HUN07_00765 [Rhodococcus sp. W8901]
MSGVEVGDLGAVARILVSGAEGFEAMSADAPNMPDAGASTGVVADLLTAVAEMMSTVATSAAVAADTVEANRTAFRDADLGTGDRFLDVSGLFPVQRGEP